MTINAIVGVIIIGVALIIAYFVIAHLYAIWFMKHGYKAVYGDVIESIGEAISDVCSKYDE